MHAWTEYRRERYIEPGLEGPSGSGLTYHLTFDVPRLLLQAAHLLDGNDCDPTMPSRHTRPWLALSDMAKAYGYRYLRGVYGIECALAEQGVDPELVARFLKEREGFASEFVSLVDAAFLVNRYGENPLAVRSVLTMFVAEMESLCDWLALAGQSSDGDVIRHNLAPVSDFIDLQNSLT